MPSTTPKQARTTRYFTGRPCKNGHVAERMVSNKNCVACLRERSKAWAKAHPDKVAAQGKRSNSRPDVRKKRAARRVQWYQRNRESQDTRCRNWRKSAREALIQQFGGKCAKCPESDPIVLDFDHIADDGHLDNGTNIIFRVKKDPSRFQLLCKNCNWKKEYHRRQHALEVA